MQTRVAVISIIIEDPNSVQEMNDICISTASISSAAMGIPYRTRKHLHHQHRSGRAAGCDQRPVRQDRQAERRQLQGGLLQRDKRTMKQTEMKTLSPGWKIALIVLPILTGVLALGIGRIWISPREVLSAIAGVFTGESGPLPNDGDDTVNLRLPRILLAMLAGAGLATAGCAFQSLFANPLATPDTLGVASGASFGAALGILLGFGMIGIQLVSLLMGAAAVTLTWLAGWGRGRG